MNNATLVLIFSGLIAFVPNDARHPNFMMAYLLKNANHEAKLRVPLSSLMDAAQCSSSCKVINVKDTDYCDCLLDDAGIKFDPNPEQSRGYIRPNTFDVLPENDNALNLAWLVRLANVGGTNAPGGSELEKKSVASVVFGWASAVTCAFDEEKIDDYRKVYAFDFEKGDPTRKTHAQALSELVVFRGRLSRRLLVLRIVSRSGKLIKELKVKCDDGVCPVAISNRAEADGSCETCEECAEGDHFDHYYDLLAAAPNYRPIPYRRCGENEQAKIEVASAEECPNFSQLAERKAKPAAWEQFLANELDSITAVSNRVICPMAILDP